MKNITIEQIGQMLTPLYYILIPVLIFFVVIGIGKFICNDKCTEIYDKLFVDYQDSFYHLYIPVPLFILTIYLMPYSDSKEPLLFLLSFLTILLSLVTGVAFISRWLCAIYDVLSMKISELHQYFNNKKQHRDAVKLRRTTTPSNAPKHVVVVIDVKRD